MSCPDVKYFTPLTTRVHHRDGGSTARVDNNLFISLRSYLVQLTCKTVMEFLRQTCRRAHASEQASRNSATFVKKAERTIRDFADRL